MRAGGGIQEPEARSQNCSEPPHVGSYVCQVYSAGDLARYLNLQRQLAVTPDVDVNSPAYQSAWAKLEALRNLYGGMPPKQLTPEAE